MKVNITKDGVISKGEKIYSQFSDKDGYLKVKLNNKSEFVHRLVAIKYLGEIPTGYSVNHQDGNKKNNNVENLEIVTHKENVIHAWKTGLCVSSKGEKHGRSILNEQQVMEIISSPKKPKNGRGDGVSNKYLSDKYGVSVTRISAIRNNKEWKHIAREV